MNCRWFSLLFIFSFSFSTPKITATPFGIIETDISYASNKRNSLDLYLPNTKKFPMVLLIHGGSFVAGNKNDFPFAQIGELFQRNGIGCAVMSYRLMQDSVWPAQPRDVAKAVKWLTDNIDEYDALVSNFYIVGHSAGGHLAALVSTDSSYLHEVGLSLNDIAGSISIGAMMSDGGSLDILNEEEQRQLFKNDWFFKIFRTKENFVKSLPIHHVNINMPKILLLLADSERINPPKEKTALEFVNASLQFEKSVEYQVIPNRTHMGLVESMVNSTDPAFQSILRFISE